MTHSQKRSNPAALGRGDLSMRTLNPARNALSLSIAAAMTLAAAAWVPHAHALEFGEGDLKVTVDTTVSYGVSVRVQDIDDNLVGKSQFNPLIGFACQGAVPCTESVIATNDRQRAARGRFSVNSDDGNQKWEKGDIFSNALKATSEISINYLDQYGAFARITGFYDFENMGRDDIAPIAKDKVGQDVQLLDMFVFANFDILERSGTVRLGKQVVSWGESTFIQGGINVINPVDVSKLRTAGSEIKEAFLPVDMFYATFGLTDNLSVEGFYAFEFEQTEPEPSGTYFSTNDFAALGGDFVMLNFGLTDEPRNFAACQQTLAAGVNATSTIAQRLEFSGCSAAVPRGRDRLPRDRGDHGVAFRYFAENLNSSELALYYVNYASRVPVLSGIAVTNSNANSARYFAEYPEGIELYGASINTTFDASGIAFQGEVSYRPNIPLQADDVELLFSALSPLNALIPQPVNRFVSQLGTLRPGQELQGWERHKLSQAQFTLTKVFGPENPIRAQQISVVGEAGATKVWDLPAPSVLRYQGDGTDTGGGPDIRTGAFRNPETQVGGFATSYSWGYRLAARADYNNVFGSFNLSPRLAFNHDVSGISPGPGGQFIEGRKSYTVGMEGTYLNNWGADISYTRFFGAGKFNLINDRDFASFIIRYSF
jgi:hypothetical protein